MIQYLLMVCSEGNDYKYCYLTLIIIFNTNDSIFINGLQWGKWLQVLLFDTNYYIQH